MQDIVTQKKSIRQIPLDKNRRSTMPPSHGNTPEPPRRLPPTSRQPGVPRGVLIAIIVVGALLVIFASSLLFSSASLSIVPKQADAAIAGTFAADRTGSSSLQFSVVTVQKSESKDATATGAQNVSKKASGQIIVYNNYSSAPQQLVANTRFQTNDGLIFRISNPITVPGTTVSGGKTIPGSIEVTVTADQPGDKYNIPLSDFTVPGFKGDPRYDKFYARSKTPMAGGLVGQEKTVSADDTQKINTELQTDLKTAAIQQLQNSLPSGTFMFPAGVRASFQSLPNVNESSGDMVKVTEQITLQAIVFDKNAFAAFVATQAHVPYDGNKAEVTNTDSLQFALTNAPDTTTFDSVDTITFSLNGTAHIVWTFDEAQLKEDLAGKQKKDVPAVLAHYPGIEKAKVIMRPPWKQTFPSAPSKIKIDIVSS